MTKTLLLIVAATAALAQPTYADDSVERDVRQALDRAVSFYAQNASKHGGYVWRYSKDFTLSEGEAETDADTVWVQPPGTPTVGEAFLDAYDATGNPEYLAHARKTGAAVAQGRRHSGGWHYSIEFDPAVRAKMGYVENRNFKPKSSGRDKRNYTTLDDDTTTAAIRFLTRLDGALGGRDREIREAAIAGLDTLVVAQRANGGWPQNWSQYPKPDERPSPGPASYPETWSRKWLNDWPGKYYLNDDVAGQTIRTLLDGYDRFKDERYRQAAFRGGEFLQSARMPRPQPAWSQQYDADMHPCWDRKFEPPAISGHESEDSILVLTQLAERTGEMRFVDGLDESIAYLRSIEIAPGKMARFYELKTNKPLYFDNEYQLTYDGSDVPDHYGFVFDSKADALERRLKRVQAKRPLNRPKPSDGEVHKLIGSLDDRGGWLSDRGMKGFRKASQEGVYESDVFVKNINTLARYLNPAIEK